MSMKKLVLITALFSLSSIAADNESWWRPSQSKKPEHVEKPANVEKPTEAKQAHIENSQQGETPLEQAKKFFRDIKEDSLVQEITLWLAVPLEQRVKDNPKTALALAAAAGAMLRKTSLAVGAGVAVYHLVKKPQPEESAIKQVVEKPQPAGVNSEAQGSANLPQGDAKSSEEPSKVAQLAAAAEQASK